MNCRVSASRSPLPTLLLAVAALFGVPDLVAQRSASTHPPTPFGYWTGVVREAEALSPISGVIVSQRGEIVVEEYFRGMTRETYVNVKSISKTLLSPLVGIAIRDGLLEGPDQAVAELFPDYFATGHYPQWDGVTLHQLLSMTTGIRGTSFGRYGAWVSSPDWVAGVLERPMRCAPGDCWEYSTGNSHLIGVILARVSGMDLRQYASSSLFARLGISLRSWDRDPQGNFLGGNNMALRAKDLLTFGELFLHQGLHEGQQLVPAIWIRRSWQQYAVSPWNGHGHGYFWWSRDIDGTRINFAWGYGGQYMFVVPDREAVVVIISSLSRSTPRGHNRRVWNFFRSEILPKL